MEEDEFHGYPMVTSALVVLFMVAVFIFGHILAGKPLTSLGQQWGCWGYDCVTGRWSVCATLVLGMIVIMIGLLELPLVGRATKVISLILSILWSVWMALGKPVSHPGPARKRKIERQPHWDHVLELPSIGKWRCATAAVSHTLTHKENPSDVQLTGEPAGRQIWTQTPLSTAPQGLDVTITDDVKDFLGIRDFSFDPERNPNAADLPFRCQKVAEWVARGRPLPSNKTAPDTPEAAARKAIQFYQILQSEDGHWAGDYGGPHFLMPGLIIAWYVMGQPEELLSAAQRDAMVHYLRVHQQSDGGWGTHIESPSTMFGSCLCYVGLRLLGVPQDDMCAEKGRTFIRQNGGALYTSSWAKFWLCVLGVMDWAGHHSIPVEMWLLPNWFPFHPARMWCHCRMVYLPMGYLYCSRFAYPRAHTDPVTVSLREELYPDYPDYASIPWESTRSLLAPMDMYSPIPIVMRVVQEVLAVYERPLFKPFRDWLRRPGLAFCADYMAVEDLQTNYVDIGPVNKVMNMLCAWHRDGQKVTPPVTSHFLRIPDYLWVAEDGMKMQGYNGSQSWDTSLAIQGIVESGLADEFPEVCQNAWKYLERTQILSTRTSQSTEAFKYEAAAERQKYYRHVSQGGWPFSTSAHGWPIGDCTSEGMKAMLCLVDLNCIQAGVQEGSCPAMAEKRFQDAVNVILCLQNPDGGFPTYENNRGYGWYEMLNPSDVFGDIMIDYSYVECSSACLQALTAFRTRYPHHRPYEIADAINQGRDFLHSIQRADGSWYGSWACCFTYGCWFGVEGLMAAEGPLGAYSPSVRRACDFLLGKQNENGGWGEDFRSCYDKEWPKEGMEMYGTGGSGVVPTAWALLALMRGRCPDAQAVERGIKYLMVEQSPSGDWPQQGISGVFNRSCGITYTAYRNLFPIWALGRYTQHYLPWVKLREEVLSRNSSD
uniref:Terpene cyclase/mutase family member n=1 Tax=Eutreptiella gymnastica TaxID=73025 RepID=A0A7S1NID4_9EUGL